MSPSPSPLELAARAQSNRREYSNQPAPTHHQQSSSALHSRSTDSWIDISSHPSNSSLSSAADEVVTTGLRVSHDSTGRSRRRQPPAGDMHLDLNNVRSPSAGGSSQEEYDESESGSDRVMTSSNEGIHASIGAPHRLSSMTADQMEDEDDDDDDEDEIATALGTAPADQSCFTPQPNAFSHPPSQIRSVDFPVAGSYFPATSRPSDSRQRHSYPSQSPNPRRHQPSTSHSPYSAVSPSHHADHDAALRASLNTLLSCAAAVRGLPKSNQRNGSSSRTQQPASNRVDPTTLRMVPESVVLGESPAPDDDRNEPLQTATNHPRARQSPSRPSSPSQHDKSSKRKATSKDRRAAKKARATPGFPYLDPASAHASDVSPTLLTWVVSAGVLVLVSALSFSAGYAVGKESGRAEQKWFSSLDSGSAGADGVRDSMSGMGRGGRLRSVAVAARG